MLHAHPLCVSVSSKLTVTMVVWRTQKNAWGRGSRRLSCVCTQENMSTCDMNTVLGHWRRHLASWTCTFFKRWCDKEGRNLITSQDLIGIFHMQTYTNKKTFRHMNLRTHTTHTVKWPDRNLLSDSSQRQWDGSFVHCEGHNGLGCVCNMKVCALGSDNLFFPEEIILWKI